MTAGSRTVIGIAVAVACGVLIWALRDVLMPFVLGLAIAYLLDPLADRLERLGVGRGVAAFLLLLAFFLVFVAALLVVLPLLQAQIAGFAERLPGYLESLRAWAKPLVQDVLGRLGESDRARLQDAAGSYVRDAVRWLGRVVASLWGGGLAVFHVLSLLFITPLVAFYLLRDWDALRDTIVRNLPANVRDDICEQAAEIDGALSGFVRGQSMVCLSLGFMYGIGLSLIGLEFGLLVGVGSGLLSFIPYFGTGVGLVVSVGIGLTQFGVDWPLLAVIFVFVIGQTVEGFWLTPHLVGGRVRLHPVWVIFALMAGGALFGFTGVLLAVPVAAAAGVLLRFAFARYRSSALYGGRS